jgi:hypothetical protein
MPDAHDSLSPASSHARATPVSSNAASALLKVGATVGGPARYERLARRSAREAYMRETSVGIHSAVVDKTAKLV